ncbi:MAG: MFS transporter [Pigmentiphaga sp.]|nr:MFS transporter [Pigmentiphaga sp.]
MPSIPSTRMNALERRASLALAGLFACRMLGLFLLLPVFAVAVQGVPGGNDPARVGLALGMYGLTQAVLQIPFGLASDRWGRKPIVITGLVMFIIGSLVCTFAQDILWITIGRAIQGAGAISAAITAWLADVTRDEVRTKAMAMVGGAIGLAFAVSLVGAPLLVGLGGLTGLFWAITLLGVAALAVALWWIPLPPPREANPIMAKTPARAVLAQPDLWRFNVGVFVLHLVQVALFVVVPGLLARTGNLAASELWKVYLPVILLSFVFMVPIIFAAERRGAHRQALLAAVVGLTLTLGLLPWASHGFATLVAALVAFFVMFNILEALQPSIVSRLAPPAYKGLALGFYNTAQAAGLFAGGALGGWLAATQGYARVFEACAVLAAIWLLLAWRMRPLPAPGASQTGGVGEVEASRV